MDRVEDPRATGEVLDVVVAAVLPGGNGAGAVAADRGQHVTGCRAGQHIFLQRWQRERRHTFWIGVDQRLLAGVPARQQLWRRRCAEEPRVRDAGELDTGKMPGGALLTGEIPNRFVCIGELVGEEAAPVCFRKNPGIAPALTWSISDLLRHRTEVKDVDDEQIARFGALDVE